jgi:cyclic-di-AMP phosphodiesterase PgpH
VVVVLALVAARDGWRAESVPIILFGLTLAVALGRPTALLLGATVGLIVSLALGQGLPEFLLLASSVVIPTLMLDRVRTRTKLIQVGVVSGLLVFIVACCISGVAGQAFGTPHWTHVAMADDAESLTRLGFSARVVAGAAWHGLCVMLAGFLMTGLLPFVERALDVQTDIRLLELGDAAHPLLQQLAQRAPGTYNHSINVGSIGEAAAEAIGANGLLVRVGAYFHDIGKMFKPEYFIENQSAAGNQHDSLVPAMSKLVIIAHVKDGVNLARQHGVPKSIRDFIEQHHGTTLVEYFYRQAVQREGDPNGTQTDESSFRYPGPKPRTREAAVLMMADGVESACRALIDPAPARIESLVHDLAFKRLQDGQFEACGLTLSELHTVEESLIKSLTAVYHGRIKYPHQQTA